MNDTGAKAPPVVNGVASGAATANGAAIVAATVYASKLSKKKRMLEDIDEEIEEIVEQLHEKTAKRERLQQLLFRETESLELMNDMATAFENVMRTKHGHTIIMFEFNKKLRNYYMDVFVNIYKYVTYDNSSLCYRNTIYTSELKQYMSDFQDNVDKKTREYLKNFHKTHATMRVGIKRASRQDKKTVNSYQLEEKYTICVNSVDPHDANDFIQTFTEHSFKEDDFCNMNEFIESLEIMMNEHDDDDGNESKNEDHFTYEFSIFMLTNNNIKS
jgi:hypothetical protein